MKKYFIVCYTAYDIDSTKINEWESGEYSGTPDEGFFINGYYQQHPNHKDCRVVYMKELDEKEFKNIHAVI